MGHFLQLRELENKDLTLSQLPLSEVYEDLDVVKDEKEKLERANFIINTDKAISETKKDVEDLYNKINEMAA